MSRHVPAAIEALVKVDGDKDLAVWAQAWGFTDAWAKQAARSNLAWWREDPRLVGRWVWVSGDVTRIVQRADEPFPRLELWDPAFESEVTFRRRVDVYVKAIKGYRLAMPPSRHFSWLALFQVGRQSITTIAANEDGADAMALSSVSTAVKNAASIVGVTLRRGRRGPKRNLGRKLP